MDAAWVWTEPHSRRLKLKLTVQKEVFSGTILQQVFVVEFTQTNEQCGDCEQFEAKDTWTAVVQVRQRVTHKKTFLWLEQLIIKHNAQVSVTNMEPKPDGIDFFFGKKGNARKFVEFLNYVVPIRTQETKKQIGHDAKSNIYRFKHSYLVEIVPVCREDLVCLPPRLAHQLGGSSPLMIVWKVSNKLRLLDPISLKTAELQVNQFWNNPFRSIAGTGQLTLYVIFDVVQTGRREGKFQLCEVQLAREADFGRNDRMTTIVSHLGTILKPGNHAWGYATEGLMFSDQDMQAWKDRTMPEIILVKKAYVNRRRNRKGRHWKLGKLVQGDVVETNTKADLFQAERDREEFLNELEEDPEYRGTINLIAEDNAEEIIAGNKVKSMAMGSDNEDDEDDGDEDDFPEVEMSELIQATQQMGLGPEGGLGPEDM